MRGAPAAVACFVTASLLLAAPAALAAASPSARGLPITRCSAHQGTIVAVDFAHWGGPVVRGCVLNQPSGYRLLRAAGFQTAGDLHDGSAFTCRLGDAAFAHGTQYPTPSEDACVQTPPTSAYWSYWLAPAGQNHWAYGQLGAIGDVPKPGEVELWNFGGTDIAGTRGSGLPPFTPDELRASNRGSVVGPGGPRLVDAVATAGRATGGSAAPLVVGICLAGLLCGGAGWAVLRRRDE